MTWLDSALKAIVIFFILFCITSWFSNAGKLFKCDFDSPYKTEVIRAFGVVILPLGVTAGFMDIGEEN